MGAKDCSGEMMKTMKKSKGKKQGANANDLRRNKHRIHALFPCNGRFGHLENCFFGKSKTAKAKRGEQ